MLGRTYFFRADIDFPKGGAPSTKHYTRDLAARRPGNPSPRLCARCQDWDVPEFAAGRGSKAHYYLQLGAVLGAGRSGCLVCAAVGAAVEARRAAGAACESAEWLRRASAEEVYVAVQGPFFLDSGYAVDQEPRLAGGEVRLFLEVTVSLVRVDGGGGVPAPFAVTPQFRMKYSAGGEEVPRLVGVEEWEVERFEIGTLKGWIQHCERSHKACGAEYASISEWPRGFRVIDMREMKIVQPAEPLRFVALSYMWEASEGAGHAQLVNANAEDLGTQGSLSAVSLPRIITDTISLCRDLGERYLWVDRLCIVQDDERSKPDQIDGMDRIYRSAAFAIMAALDDRTGKGLPGYIDERRPRASLWGPPRNRNSRRGIDPNGVQATVDSSLWNRRGWTFQERLFTKRRLFITEYQVLFECCRAQAAEELTWGPRLKDDPYHSPAEEADHDNDDDDCDAEAHAGASHDDEKRKEKRHSFRTGFYCKPRFGRSTTIQLQDRITLADYCLWVENYTPRELSHGGDVLNAFAGVGNAVRKAMKTEVMYGLPAVCLPQALMWSHTGTATRREETAWIPSWSWAGWVGKADYRWMHGEAKLNESKLVRVVTLVAFHFQDPGHGLRRVGVRERWLGMEMRKMNIVGPDKLPRLQRRMSGGKINVSEEMDRVYEEMWNGCPHSPWEALARPGLDPAAVEIAGDFPGCLVLNTTVASLRIGRDRRRSGTRTAGEFEDAEILDVMGRQVGYLDKMDPEWIAGRKGKRDRRRMLDFIVISAGLQEATSERGQWAFIEGQFHELWQFNVMLVERLPYEQFVARRVGVGCVRVSRWRECNPRWETVVLC
ncbi:hypothetical protein CKAH01_04925 [Colletotrichum kahawae]|uniref:Heterokaryon incompatibility domain-containing protein n=1 Tax=Colletotrichum kahawae TaxID=34407 RepID=A0AAD9YHM0_COLKA|nr:hypothetical protein CKAH01_04925 [Colletotrichum kahawae]